MHSGYHSTYAELCLPPSLSLPNALTHFHRIMADRNSRFTVKKKETKVENKASDDKGKEKAVKKPDKVVKKPEKTPEQPNAGEEKRNGATGGATGAEASNSEENGEFQPIELPPFEIVTGWVRFNTHTGVRVSVYTPVLLCNTSTF